MEEPEKRWRALSVLAQDALWQSLAARFLEFVAPASDGSVLELGCSSVLSRHLAQWGNRLTQADPDSRCLGPQSLPVSATLLETPLDKLPLPTHAFQGIVSLTGLWDGSGTPATLDELSRLLSPGGIFGAVLPARHSATGATLELPERLWEEVRQLEALSSTRMPSEALFEVGHPPERSLEYQLRVRGFRRIRSIELLGGHFYALKAWR